ncbi:MAG: AI-2E family transporter [Spirochaetes bacterium]|nr:AI-2E family transporter [Spirochaetota bacterium]
MDRIGKNVGNIKNILMAVFIVMIFYLLKTLSALLMPFVLALLFAILFQPLILKLEAVKLPRRLILPVITIISLLIIIIIFNIFTQSITEIMSEQEYLAGRLYHKLEQFLVVVNNSIEYEINVTSLVSEIKSLLNLSILSKTAGGLALSLSSFTGSFIMFAIYYIIFLSGMSNYKNFLHYVGDGEKGEHMVEGFEIIQKSIFSYLTIKTLISLITGFLAGAACWIFDIRFAVIFGILTFMLNFIPSIGSIIATFPPVLMALIQSDTVLTPVLLFVILILIQQLMGTVIEPRIIGDRLRLNTFTVIFGLIFWGYIWGIPGMFLSVPFMVIVKLILEKMESTIIIARIMGYPEKSKKAPVRKRKSETK